ncbi:MAG: heavy metal translocating P-type ATPase metal-binding domain-containing protein, partial [Flavobacteriales bacterium]
MTLFTPVHTNPTHSPTPPPTPTPTSCFHCGEKCPDIENVFDEKHFCCDGCKAVYRMLNENGLCGYYEIDESKGISPKLVKNDERFAYLEDISTQNNILTFQNEEEAHVQLSLPQMHCSSCVWLLEH